MDSCTWPLPSISSVSVLLPRSSPHPDTLRSNLARLLGDVLAARPFDCHSDSPELQESWPCSVCGTARHNRPQRAALEKQGLAARIWASSAPLLPSLPTAVFLQLASDEQMHGIREHGLSSSSCFPRTHRGAPEFGSICRWCSRKCVVTLTPTADAVPPRRAAEILSCAPAQSSVFSPPFSPKSAGNAPARLLVRTEWSHPLADGSGGQVAARLAHTKDLCREEGKA